MKTHFAKVLTFLILARSVFMLQMHLHFRNDQAAE